MIQVITADAVAHAGPIRELFQEYLEWACPVVNREFGADFDAPSILDGDMQHLDRFMPPGGRLLLAYVDDRLAGIACLKSLEGDIGEVKRMYVRPQARGMGVGRLLLDHLLEEARRAGYRRVRLDSARFMADAHRLYRASGFRDIAAYEGSEIPKEFQKHWVFMELELPREKVSGAFRTAAHETPPAISAPILPGACSCVRGGARFRSYRLTRRQAVEKLTGSVTRGWVGGRDAILPEPTSSHTNCLKTRRLPPVGCTQC